MWTTSHERDREKALSIGSNTQRCIGIVIIFLLMHVVREREMGRKRQKKWKIGKEGKKGTLESRAGWGVTRDTTAGAARIYLQSPQARCTNR